VTFHNLMKQSVEVDKKSFLDCINARRPIGITIDGEIVTGKAGDLPPQPYLFVGTPRSLTGGATVEATPLAKILGESYEVRDEGEKITIYAGRAWQELLAANAPFATYQDTTADGIVEFSDEALENLIWYSCEFGINHRDVAEHLEERMDGRIVCIENERPYSFTGSAFIDDLEAARCIAFDFIRSVLSRKIEEGTIDPDDLSKEEEEALNFFGLRD